MRDDLPIREVQAVVFAVLLDYHQVKVRDAAGFVYALTARTAGVELAALEVGQRVLCQVVGVPSRVVSARLA